MKGCPSMGKLWLLEGCQVMGITHGVENFQSGSPGAVLAKNSQVVGL